MSELQVVSTRSGLVESVHDVSVAVVDAAGALAWSTGDPHLVTYWRSAAKPFQALASVVDGVAEAFGFDSRALALACASHSGEPVHRELAAQMLARVGLTEAALACGAHPPLGASLEAVPSPGETPTPLWNNCSGKHALMLALARHHGWPTQGYERADHPVQRRILAEVAKWCGVPPAELHQGVDGCTVVCFALPLSAMATAWCRLGTSTERAPTALREAMAAHPHLVAGTGRLCTDVMVETKGEALVKVGAEGVYCAALPRLGLGVALKVHDGHGPSAAVALLAVLRRLLGRAVLPARASVPVVNTRGAQVGSLSPLSPTLSPARGEGEEWSARLARVEP